MDTLTTIRRTGIPTMVIMGTHTTGLPITDTRTEPNPRMVTRMGAAAQAPPTSKSSRYWSRDVVDVAVEDEEHDGMGCYDVAVNDREPTVGHYDELE